MVRSSQKRFLSFPVMGAMDIVCVGVGEDDSDGGDNDDNDLGRYFLQFSFTEVQGNKALATLKFTKVRSAYLN